MNAMSYSVCPKCQSEMIKQEIDEVWFCENCDKPHGEQIPTVDEGLEYRKCAKCGKDSGIFEFCKDCRPENDQV